MKIKLGVGGLVAAAVMGVLTEIGNQVVSQKWDDFAEKKGLPKFLTLGSGKEADEEDEDTED